MSDLSLSRIFISHAGRDRAWAEWARWHLETAGYPTELDSIDWPPGSNFVTAMDQALRRDYPMLVLLSAAYLDPERYTTDEWTARLAQRRKHPDAKLIPLRVDRVDLHDGLWSPIVVPDVFDLPADTAVTVLLDAVRRVLDPASPSTLPVVPPPYPGVPSSTTTAGSGAPRPPGSLPSVWNLARRNPGFTGRDTILNQLHDTLRGGSRVAVQALYGMGGVGKTQLALEYGHRFAGQYDVVWWIPAERTELIAGHLAALAARLHLVAAGIQTPDAVRALKDHLRQTAGWLLIFDNAEDRDQVVPWLPDGPGHVLITSRDPHWVGVAVPVDVDVFTRPESMALLRAHLPHMVEEDADRLAAALGDLPLAVGQAADLLAETRLPAAAYLSELAGHADDLLRQGRPGVGHPAPFAATVTLAADRLRSADPAAGQLLDLCAWLGPEPIPVDLLFSARPDLLPRVLSTVARQPLAFARTVVQLARYGLARRSDNGSVLHRLTQAVLRDTDTDPDTHRHTVERVLAAARPADCIHPQWWPRWSLLLPHILAAEPATSTNFDLRRTANEAVQYLLICGDSRTALSLAQHLHRAWTALYGPDDDSTLAIANTLAEVHRELGHYQLAHDLIQDTFTRRRRIHGDDHPDTLDSACGFAVYLGDVGDYERARQLAEDTLARRRRVLGDDHRDTLNSANNVASDLLQAGEYERGRELTEDTLARQRRVLGDDHPDTLRSALNLAIQWRRVGEYKRARELVEDTLARYRRVLGDDHPDTLNSANYLAIILWNAGKYERARELLEDTLARRRRVLGDDHPDTLDSADNLVEALESLGKHERARELRQQFPPVP